MQILCLLSERLVVGVSKLRKHCFGFGRGEEGTQHSPKLQLSTRLKHFVKACLQGFQMPLTPTLNFKWTTSLLQSTISYLNTRKSAILHNTQNKAHGRTGGKCHSPLMNFFWGGGGGGWQIGVHRKIHSSQKLEFFCITWLALRSLKRNNQLNIIGI